MTRHKDVRINRWKRDMDESLRARVKWVMKEPTKDVGAYERRWGNEVECWADGAGTRVADPDENADDLRRVARRGRWTAAGADGWRPGHLAMLPPVWWERAAELWRMATRTGTLPEAWMHTDIVGIDKADGGVRPISVAAAMLRIGISAMLERLRDWMGSWTPSEVVGGVPGRDARWILKDLGDDIRRSATEDGNLVGIKLDVKACFDRVRFEDTRDLLKRLGAPERLLTVLTATDGSQHRWIEYNGAIHPVSIRAKRGIPQGCPASPLRLAAIMAAWHTR